MKNTICLLLLVLGLTFIIQCESDAKGEEAKPGNGSACDCVRKMVFEVNVLDHLNEAGDGQDEIILYGPWVMSDGPIVQIRDRPALDWRPHWEDGDWFELSVVPGNIAFSDGRLKLIKIATQMYGGLQLQVVVLY